MLIQSEKIVPSRVEEGDGDENLIARKGSYLDQNEKSVAKVLALADTIEASKADYKEVYSYDTFKEMVMTIRIMHERVSQLET